MPTSISVSDYQIELRDKNNNFKGYITPWVSKVSWEWNRIGGCGRCSITINKAYRNIDFEARDDIQIRIKSGTTSKLVYRGYIANITPVLKVPQDIKLDVRGYFDLLKKIVVHTNGDTRTYTNKSTAYMADDIADTFIVAKTNITIAGAITAGNFVVDTLDFFCTVDSALRTLAEIQGDVEYGVDEDLEFYWVTESEVVNNRFFAGDNVLMLERRKSWDSLVNKIYLVGGEVDGVKYKKTMEANDSQTENFLSEEIINNSSIVTDGVAHRYMGAILSEKSNPEINIRAQIKNTNIRMEDTLPLGLVSFYDSIVDEITPGDIIGETGDGGSNITIGLATDGGSDAIIGGQFRGAIDRIAYTPSDTPGRFNIEIQLGDTILETSAKIKRIELSLASITQGG